MAALVTLLFFVSGLAALAYQIVWVRALGLLVGSSLWATVVVVAAYMGGMAIGSGLVARFSARIRHHLRLYGIAEALAALVALATPAAMGLLGPVAARLGAEPLAGWGLPLLGRFLLAWSFLAVPTIAMGATLPLLVERIGRHELLGSRVSRLYAANTFGAVCGVVLAGFVALPVLGERATLAVGAILGLIVAGLAAFLENRVPVFGAPAPPTRAGRRADAWLLYPLLFGFVALACELVWTRILLLHLGSRVYAFALVLAVYLTGIALGAMVARRLRAPASTSLAACQVLVGATVVMQIAVFARFGDLLAWLAVHLHPVGFVGLQLCLALGVAVLLLPPTLLFGASFPLAVAAYPSAGGYAERTGKVGAANTLGGIFGTVAGPLLLVPLLGSQRSLLILGLVGVTAGLALSPGWRRRSLAGAVAAGLVVALVVLPPGLVLRGAAAVTEGVVETLSESTSATVVVRRFDDARGQWRSLELNGVNVAGTSPELRAIQRLQGHLPLLLHPQPRTVLHIGFGSGGTAWAVSRHPVTRIVVAEISPEVLAVSDLAFAGVNHGVLRDPRVSVVLNDGRNVLLATDERFDVILSDSIHPVYAGNSTLYTREYFELCRRHLAPDGVVSMWLPMYSLSVESYLSIVRAFWEVFPGTCIWYDPVVLNEFTVVTGTSEPGAVKVRWDALAAPSLAPTLREAGVNSPRDLGEMVLLGPAEVAGLVRNVLPHVDDFPEVEYRSGRVLDREVSWRQNFMVLYMGRTRRDPFAAFPGSWRQVAAERDRTTVDHMRELRERIARR